MASTADRPNLQAWGERSFRPCPPLGRTRPMARTGLEHFYNTVSPALKRWAIFSGEDANRFGKVETWTNVPDCQGSALPARRGGRPRVSASRTDSSRGELAMTPSSSRTFRASFAWERYNFCPCASSLRRGRRNWHARAPATAGRQCAPLKADHVVPDFNCYSALVGLRSKASLNRYAASAATSKRHDIAATTFFRCLTATAPAL